MNERMKLQKDVIANQFFLTQDRGLKCGRFLYVTTTFSNSLWSVGVSTSMEEFDSWMCTKPIETGIHNILENLSTCEMSLWFCNFACSSILTESIKWAWRASFEYAHLVRSLPSIQKWCRCFPSVACMCVCARAFSFLVSLFLCSRPLTNTYLWDLWFSVILVYFASVVIFCESVMLWFWGVLRSNAVWDMFLAIIVHRYPNFSQKGYCHYPPAPRMALSTYLASPHLVYLTCPQTWSVMNRLSVTSSTHATPSDLEMQPVFLSTHFTNWRRMCLMSWSPKFSTPLCRYVVSGGKEWLELKEGGRLEVLFCNPECHKIVKKFDLWGFRTYARTVGNREHQQRLLLEYLKSQYPCRSNTSSSRWGSRNRGECIFLELNVHLAKRRLSPGKSNLMTVRSVLDFEVLKKFSLHDITWLLRRNSWLDWCYAFQGYHHHALLVTSLLVAVLYLSTIPLSSSSRSRSYQAVWSIRYSSVTVDEPWLWSGMFLWPWICNLIFHDAECYRWGKLCRLAHCCQRNTTWELKTGTLQKNGLITRRKTRSCMLPLVVPLFSLLHKSLSWLRVWNQAGRRLYWFFNFQMAKHLTSFHQVLLNLMSIGF